jgi:hypothetical protein
MTKSRIPPRGGMWLVWTGRRDWRALEFGGCGEVHGRMDHVASKAVTRKNEPKGS